MSTKLAGIIVATLVAGFLLVRPAFVERIDDYVCDVLTGAISRGGLRTQVVIVEIDEAGLSQFGRWPWRRDLLGRLVQRVLDRGAATVALDIALNAAPGAGDGDEVLAATLRGRPVVIGYPFRFGSRNSEPSPCTLRPLPLVVAGPATSWEPEFFHPSGVICNAGQISDAAAGEGFLNAAVDGDGKLRRVPLTMEYGDRQYASFALAAVNVYRGKSPMQLNLQNRGAATLSLGTEVVHLEGRCEMRLRYRGRGRTFPYIPVSSVLDDRSTLENLRGKIVIIGGSALGLPNPVATALDPQFPDAEVQATAIDNLLLGDSLRRPASLHFWESLVALVAGIAATFLLSGRWRTAILVLTIAVGVWIGAAVLLSNTGFLFSPLPLTAVLACNVPSVALLKYIREKQRAERTEEQLRSERKKAKALLGESESRYQRLVENINDAITVHDTDMRLVFANRRFREWFGLGERDIHEIVLEDWVAPEWCALLRDAHMRRMRGEKVSGKSEYQGVRPGGTRIWIEALVTNVVVEGRVDGTQSALRDITERKLIEAQYLQAQKMESVGRLAGGVAHDFNNLLQVINGYADIMLSDWPEDDEHLANLKAIRAAGERATELTRNLLTFSRKQVARSAILDLNAVVEEAARMFGQLIGEDIELTMALGPALAPVMADAGQIHQILMNLLINSRDAMPCGGKIRIETKNVEVNEAFLTRHPKIDAGSWVYLGVKDSGSGMSDEVMAHLFEPFFTTKAPGRGTGLGLATIYGIVEQSAGRIEVTSELGAGTTFHIYLPKATGELAVLAETSNPTGSIQGSGTILVVEDQGPVRQYLLEVLKSSGFTVLEAENGVEALELARDFQGVIDLMVTDLVMPLMNGPDLAERLRLTRPEMKVLFMSGYEKESIDHRGIGASELVYLQKPFNGEQLKARVRDALAESVTRSARASGGGS